MKTIDRNCYTPGCEGNWDDDQHAGQDRCPTEPQTMTEAEKWHLMLCEWAECDSPDHPEPAHWHHDQDYDEPPTCTHADIASPDTVECWDADRFLDACYGVREGCELTAD